MSTIPIDTESEVVLRRGSRGLLSCREEGNLTLINNAVWEKLASDTPLITGGYYQGVWEKGGHGYDKGLYDIDKNFSLIIRHVDIVDHDSFFCSAAILEPRTFLRSLTNVSVVGE